MQPVHASAARLRTRIWILPAALFLLSAALVGPPLVRLNRLHGRIAGSIGRSIGRPVRMSAIELRLLPRPGFVISDFVVEDDPAFGAEPILRSPEATAYVRLLSLWRGRLEIARIAFDGPSLNLVRNRGGQWNFDPLLTRAAQTPKAPTAERHPGGLPRFPYIDASNARINFKYADEKLPFSFLNADLAVWLQNPGEWRIQFAAQPVRTDLTLELADTGTFRLEGSVREASSLFQMPVRLHASWSGAALGQLSRIVTGSDAEWRGDLAAAADITGTVDQASIRLRASGRSIHRAEFAPRAPLDLDLTCEARFSRPNRLVDGLTCIAPAGDGHLLLTGSFHALPSAVDPSLSLEINNTPAAILFDGLRLLRSGFAPGLDAGGVLNGNFTCAPTEATARAQIHGHATVERLRLSGSALEQPLVLPDIHLTTEQAAAESPASRRGRSSPGRPGPSSVSSVQPFLFLEPFTFSPGAPQMPPVRVSFPAPAPTPNPAMTVSGAFDPGGFNLHLRGQSRISQLLAVGRQFGLLRDPGIDFQPQTTADVDVTIHGPWMLPLRDADHTMAPAAIDGSLRTRNAQLTAVFLAQPLALASAQAIFSGNQVEWTSPSLAYGVVRADGSLRYQSFCESPPDCPRTFSLHIATLDAAAAQASLLGVEEHDEIVQQLLDRIRSLNQGHRSWPPLSGTLAIGTMSVNKLAIQDLTASVSLEGSGMKIHSLTGRALDGLLHLSGTIDLSGDAPQYRLDAQLYRAGIGQAAALFGEEWGPGTFDLQTTLQVAGFERNDLVSSASGTFHWDWTRGGLPISPGPPAAATAFDLPAALRRFDSWTAEGLVAKNRLTLQKSRVVTGSDTAVLTGTIGFDRKLDLSAAGTPAPPITGTLQHPALPGEPTVAATPAP